MHNIKVEGLEALATGLIELTEKLNQREQRDFNVINTVLFSIDTELQSLKRGAVHVRLSWRGVKVVIVCDGFHYQLYKHNKWYASHSSLVRRGLSNRFAEVVEIRDFLYRAFDPDTDTSIKNRFDIPSVFEED